MKLKQTLPYKLKRIVPILGLAGASLFTACEEPDPRHDTVYNWRFSDYGDILPPDKVVASADSALVRNVILQYDHPVGEYCFDVYGRRAIQQVIDATSPENRHKLRGRGQIRYMYITNPADSAWLVDFGYTILNVEQSLAAAENTR